MALKDIWVDLEDKVAGVPDSGSELTVKPINDIAHSVIENEEKIEQLENKEIEITIDTEMDDTSENPVQNKVVKSYVDGKISDINNQISDLNEYDQELFNMIEEANTQIINIITSIGDINSALDELHNYAQAIISGGVS